MRRLVAFVILCTVTAGCGAPVATERSRGGSAEKPPPTTSPTPTTVGQTTTTTSPVASGPLSLPDQVSLTLIDLGEFWGEALPEAFDLAYEPVNVLGGYDVATDGPPACGDELLDAEIAIGNAFYCPADDTVAWDEAVLFPTLYDDFGPFAVSLVLAHEWGHAVQSRVLDSRLPTIVSELQADCYAGAWAGYAVDGGLVDVGPSELDVATAGFLYFRDPVAAGRNDPGAHGNAFDRVGAFADGFRTGVGTCAGYAAEFPEVTQIGFSVDELATGGNLPKSEVFPTLARTLDVWWTDVLTAEGIAWSPFSDLVVVEAGGAVACELVDTSSLRHGFGYCDAEDVLVLDVDGVVDPLYDAFGDFGPALVIGKAWAQKGQVLLGLSTTGTAADRQLDCLAGAWAGDGRLIFGADGEVLQRGLPTGEFDDDGVEQVIRLSAGDLDEAIQSILFLGEAAEDGPTAFERVESFRIGVLEGVDACLAP